MERLKKATRFLLGVGACTLVFGLTPATAESQCGANVLGNVFATPGSGYGLVAGINGVPADGQPGQSCTFNAGAGPHGYVTSPGQGFRIFIDTNTNQKFEPARGEQLLAETGTAPAGAMTIATGAPVTVQILGSCSDAGCGYLGFVAAQ